MFHFTNPILFEGVVPVVTPLLGHSVLNNRQRFYYALPVAVISLLYGGALVVLQGIYAKNYGLSLSTIAAVILFARLFDAITDPIIGYYSDRYHARRGTRKPFIVVGGIALIVSATYLFIPPDDVSDTYVLFWFLMFYLGYTLFSIPHYAWGCEISNGSQDSTRIFSMRSLLMVSGVLIFYSLPQLPFFEGSEFSPDILHFAVCLAAVLFIPAFALSIFCVPNTRLGINRLPKAGEGVVADISSLAISLPGLWKSLKYNKPLLILLGALLFWGVATGSWAGLLFIYIDNFLGMGESFSIVALLGTAFGMFGVAMWSAVTIRLGKIVTWVISSFITIISMLAMLLLDPEEQNIAVLLIVVMLIFLGSISSTLIVPALLSDIADYGEWKAGNAQSGSYFSIFFLVIKINDAVGVAIGLAVAGLFGFSVLNQEHSSEAVLGLQLGAIWLPVVLMLLSILIIIKIPIDSRRHEIIRKALARREKRSARQGKVSSLGASDAESISEERM